MRLIDTDHISSLLLLTAYRLVYYNNLLYLLIFATINSQHCCSNIFLCSLTLEEIQHCVL